MLRHQLQIPRRQIDKPNITDQTLLSAIATALPRQIHQSWIVTPSRQLDATAPLFDSINTSRLAANTALDHPTLPSSTDTFTLTSMTEVKKRRRGTSKISSKHQITIPAEALRSAGLEIGDRLVARSDGAGRVILEREHDVVAELAGALTGAYQRGELDELRSEWD